MNQSLSVTSTRAKLIFDDLCVSFGRDSLGRTLDRQEEYEAQHYLPSLRGLTYRLISDHHLQVSADFAVSGAEASVDFTVEAKSFRWTGSCGHCDARYVRRQCPHQSTIILAMWGIGSNPRFAEHMRATFSDTPARLDKGLAQWLDGLSDHDDPAPASRGPSLPAAAGLRFLLDVDTSGAVSLRSVFMTDSEPLSKARLIDFATQSSARERAIAARLTEEEQGWLMQLRGCPAGPIKASFLITSALDQQFVQRLIERQRVLLRPSADDGVPSPVRLGEPRQIAPRWEVTNALTCRLDVGLASDPSEILLNLPSPWIFDRRVPAIYPVEGLSTLQLRRLRSAPEIPRDQIKLFTEALEKLSSVPILPPDEIPEPVEEVVEPRAMVVLGTSERQRHHWHRSMNAPGQVAIVAEVFFRYGKGRVAEEDARATRVITPRGTGLVSHPRQRESETSLLRKIQAAGLKRETAYDGTVERHKWCYPEEIGREAIVLMQTLTSKGIQVEFSPSLGLRCIEDAGEETYGSVEEGSSGRYVIDAGVVVDGQRISLADLASAAMADPEFSLTPDPDHDHERRLVVPCGQSMIVSLPHARVREIIGPFFDFLVAFDSRDGRLTVSRAVLIAQAFGDRPAVPSMFDWEGMRSIREAAQRLREQGIEEVAETPLGFTGKLRDYQQTGVKWLNVLRELGLGGVLADDMGLGKTVQLLAHIAMRRAKHAEPPVLIVAPAPVIGSWKDNFHFTPGLRMLVLTGPDRASRFDQIPDADVVFSNYSTLRLDIETLAKHHYSLVVFDEAQNLKSINTVSHAVAERLQSEQVVMVSGRPVENHLGELYSQVRLALPGLLGEQRDFTRSFRTPIEKRGDADARHRLKARVLPFILRRTKDQVSASLPPKTILLRTVEMSPEQRRLYNAIMLTMNQRVWDSVERMGIASSGVLILAALRKLQQICCHPLMLKDELPGACRESAKFDFLLQEIEELVDEGRRILVFSQHVEYLMLIGHALTERAITHLMFTGKTRDKDATRAEFQTGRVPVMLVSLKAGGAGLTFTAADTVLMASPWWNPGSEDQAVDRAHRIGQTKPVMVVKYIVENSVETQILQMQEKKAALARAILDDEAGGAPPLFEIDDVVRLFGAKNQPDLESPNAIDGEWTDVSVSTRALGSPALPAPGQSTSSRDIVVAWVSEQLAEANMTAAEMNRRLQLPRQWLSNRISGNSLLPPSMLVRLTRQLSVPLPPDILAAAERAYGRDDPDLAGLLAR